MTSPATIEPLLTSAEVSAYLQIPVATLHNWAYLGRGPKFFHVGRYRRYRRADLEAWLADERR